MVYYTKLENFVTVVAKLELVYWLNAIPSPYLAFSLSLYALCFLSFGLSLPLYWSPIKIQTLTVYLQYFITFQSSSRPNSAQHQFLRTGTKPKAIGGSVSSSGSTNGLSDITAQCSTPPQYRRRLFNPKNLRSPFGLRRPPATAASSSGYTENSSTLSGKTIIAHI